VPPLPPHINFKQAKNFTAAILKAGNARDMVKQSWKEEVATLFA
jgi:hypothetical protein